MNSNQRNAPFRLSRCLLAGALLGALQGPRSGAETNGTEAPRPIHLAEAIDVCLKQNRDLALLALAAEGRNADLKAAQNEYLWTVRPDGSAETSSDGTTLGYGATVARRTPWGTRAEVGGSIREEDRNEQTQTHRGAVLIQIEQPLLRRVGRLVNEEPTARAAGAIAAARREIELRRTDLIVQVVELYEELFRLQMQAECDRQTAERLDRFFLLAQARERQGRATRVDVLRSELKAGSARLLLSGTIEQLAARRADFAELLGLTPETACVVAPAARMEVAAPARESAVRCALSNRMDYAQILQDRDDAARGVRIARRNLLPDLNLISRYERVGAGTTSSDAMRLDDSAWFVGLTLQSDFPPRGERIAAERAETDKRMAQLRMETVRSAIRRQVQQALLSHERARNETAPAERNCELARTRANLARRLFESGRGDSFTLAEAEDELREAEARMLDAEAAASVAGYRLLRVMGRLVEYPEDLKPHAAQDEAGP